MKKAVAGAALAVLILTGCGKEQAKEEDMAPLPYEERMQYAGDYIWIDTETGICYWQMNPKGDATILIDREGKPFIANGWRDFGGEE